MEDTDDYKSALDSLGDSYQANQPRFLLLLMLALGDVQHGSVAEREVGRLVSFLLPTQRVKRLLGSQLEERNRGQPRLTIVAKRRYVRLVWKIYRQLTYDPAAERFILLEPKGALQGTGPNPPSAEERDAPEPPPEGD